MQQVLIHQNLLKKVDLTSLKSEVEKLDIDKLEKVPTGLSSLKSKVDILDVDKLVPVPVDLSKLSAVVKNDVVKKTEYDELIKRAIQAKQATDTCSLVKETDYNRKINEIERKLLIMIIVISILLQKNLIS